jgi:protein-tyrosine phosphatase
MEIFDVEAGAGRVAIAPMPGLFLPLEEDVAEIAGWGARLVLSIVDTGELAHVGEGSLGHLLAAREIEWIHLPVGDFGAPSGEVERLWPAASQAAHGHLDGGGKVLVHCRGGCGRSGMVALRLLVERGEEAGQALLRLRAVRSCAVENDGQFSWAAAGVRVA